MCCNYYCYEYIQCYCLATGPSQLWVNIVSGNCLASSGNKLLPEPVLTNSIVVLLGHNELSADPMHIKDL